MSPEDTAMLHQLLRQYIAEEEPMLEQLKKLGDMAPMVKVFEEKVGIAKRLIELTTREGQAIE